ncbi:MAG: NAD(P)H-hydrate dehydratase [Acidobacteriota bacterium]
MRKILTSQEMRDIDRLTVEGGIDSLTLMETAAGAIVSLISELLGNQVGNRVLIVCGRGDNGGDGAAIARLLENLGMDVTVLLIGSVEDTRGDARINFERCPGLIQCTNEGDAIAAFTHSISQGPSVVVDAMFGTGLSRTLGGAYAAIAEKLAVLAEDEGERPLIISVDLPSGIDADRAEVSGICVKADATVTFTAPKLGNVMAPASRYVGELIVADIGSPAELIGQSRSMNFLAEESDAAAWLLATEFSEDSFKKMRGHAVMFAGSHEYIGASVLAGNSAAMSGVGRVTLVATDETADTLSSAVKPEVIVRRAADMSKSMELIIDADAIGIGSGMGTVFSADDIHTLIASSKSPIVIDADGLNAIAPLNHGLPTNTQVVLTPHQGEFLRLAAITKEDLETDRVGELRRFATRSGAVTVLKGERNLVGLPDGRVIVVPTGNPGLGKAGSGDNLAGIITGFVAQGARFGISIADTVIAAVFIAGLAGDIAEERWGRRAMTASDVRDCLSEAFKMLGDY